MATQPQKRSPQELGPALGRRFACDTETTGLWPYLGDRAFMISFANAAGSWHVKARKVDPFTRQVYWDAGIIERVQADLDAAEEIIFHNAKFDWLHLQFLGLHVDWTKVQDTMIAAHCLNNLEPSFGLKQLAKRYLKVGDEDQHDLKKATMHARREGKRKGWTLAEHLQADYWMTTGPECAAYAELDTVRTWGLWELYDSLMDDEDVRHSYEEEIALLPATASMEGRGVRVRKKTLDRCIAEQEGIVVSTADRLKAIADINWGSPLQLADLVYKKWKQPVKYWTDKGSPKVDSRALEEIDHPAVKLLIKNRAAQKCLKSFLYKYRELSKPDRKGVYIMHPDFQQVGPRTSRYSCRNPNMQNVANALTTRSSEPIQARGPLGPRPGFHWWHWDYSQLEVRIFADVSQEAFMLKTLESGEDMHTACANKAWGGHGNPAAIRAAIHALELDGSGDEGQVGLVRDVLKDLSGSYAETKAVNWLNRFEWDTVAAEKSLKKKTTRAKAKMLLFLKVFGGGAPAAADLIGCSTRLAKEFLGDYDKAFPRIQRYLRSLGAEAERNGYIINRFGRKLRIDPHRSYKAVNYMVQGSAAGLLKDRMMAAYLAYDGHPDIYPVLTIHDELVFEVKAKYYGDRGLMREMRQLMEDHTGHFNLPVPVELAITTKSWQFKRGVELPEAA